MNVAPSGSWRSPISSDLIVSQTIGLSNVAVDGTQIYWLEKRPTEKGRNVLVHWRNEGVSDVTPAPYNVRTKVHEYGGGAFLVADENIYFSHYGDNRLYRQREGESPQALTTESSLRYADLILDRQNHRLIAICEDHSQQDREAVNTIVTIDLTTGKVQNLVSGDDFYAAPRLSRNGKQLAWLSWNHPDMPWDGTYLWLAEVNSDGSLGQPQLVAGDRAESICEPKWSDDGRLYFSSDRTNWWNLYRRNPDGKVEILHEMAAEFAYPHWVFGLSTYAFSGADCLVCAYSANGSWHLGKIRTKTKQFEEIATPYSSISDLQTTGNGEVVFIGGSPTETTAVVKLNLNTLETQILKRSSQLEIDAGYLSQPEAIAFPTENDLTAYAWYYPPQNKDYTAPEGELPPLIVKSHGGPTAAASVNLNLRIQYWTSRGFGYLDVNYGGSIGYGREYRQRLEDNWGIVDVDDCVNAAKYLVARGRVDKDRLVITGGSAGVYDAGSINFSRYF